MANKFKRQKRIRASQSCYWLLASCCWPTQRQTMGTSDQDDKKVTNSQSPATRSQQPVARSLK